MQRQPSWRMRLSVSALALAGALAASSALLAQSVGPVAGPGGPGTYGPPLATNNGHAQWGNGLPPALSSCGTGPQGPFGTDVAFHFITGTSAGGVCTATPNKPYAARPTCSIDGESATPPAFSVSATGTITFLSGVQDSTRYNVICFAQPGGL